MKCEKCGLEVDLPFRCNYCEHFYCPEHRLPENHECSETWRVKAVRSARATMAPPQFQEASVLLAPRVSRALRFSRIETRHLLVGTALVAAAGATFFIGSSFTLAGLIVAIGLFSAGFILHELAHKYVAQGYGLWAEFRLSLMGALLTAISVLSPLKFIAPGAVMISGSVDRERMGRTAIAGPIVNVVISAALISLIPLASRWLLEALVAGAAINSFLAVFNLIPFAIFDGQKVYSWNRKFWAILFIASLAMTIYANFVLHP